MKRLLILLLFIISFNCAFSEEKIGLVLSGGGARGLAHIGVLKVIDEMDIQINFIVGSSIGSVIGGLYAMGYSAAEIEELIIGLNWQEVISSKIERQDLVISEKRWLPYANYYFNLNEEFVPTLPRALLSGNSLINKFFEITYSASLIDHFDELAIPFRAVATNIINGEIKVIEDWKMHEALRASMSFPSVFQPFEKKDCLYIDGGIRSNLPADVARAMGADIVIASQTSSGLRKEEDLETLIDVLDQTINIGINDNVTREVQHCDIVLQPFLQDIQLFDFEKWDEIIQIGEEEARQNLSKLMYLPKRKKKIEKIEIENKISFSAINVEGNHYLSSFKIKEHLGLRKGEKYSKKAILKAFEKVYHFSFFNQIYPTMQKIGDDITLTVHVTEKPRNQIGFGFIYREDNEMSVNVGLEMNNYLQPNSKLIANVKLGAENELNLDYVKNFGKHWGIYFRLFPHIKEHRLFSYNLEHKKINSVRSLEYGSTFGIGAYAEEMMIMELFTFADKSRHYQDIGDFESTKFTSTGAGIKFYHESLDDILFPMQGAQGIFKFSFNQKGISQHDWVKKLYSRIRFVVPFSSKFVTEYGFEYGSYFKRSEFVDYNPFYIGGINSFMGLGLREKSAPIYKINAFHLRYKTGKNTFFKLTLNVLQLGDTDEWNFFENDLMYGVGFEIAYRSPILPLRIAVAVNENYKPYYYLSIGYDFDPFEFSRK